MQIDDPFETTGEFWLPSAPEIRKGGNLRIDEHGRPMLHLVDRVGHDDQFQLNGLSTDVGDPIPTTTILGQVSKHGLVTLERCFPTSNSISLFSISPTDYSVGRAIFRINLTSKEPVLINELQLTIQGLIQWLGRTGFSQEFQKSSNSFVLKYSLPDDIIAGDHNDIDIIFQYNVIGSNCSITQQRTMIEQKAFISLRSEQPRELDEFITMAKRLQNFISLGLGQTSLIESVTAYSDDLDTHDSKGNISRYPVPIYFDDKRRNSNPSSTPATFMPFNFDYIKSNSNTLVNSWFKLYEEHENAINEFFSSTADPELDIASRFMSMIKVIETMYEQSDQEKSTARALLKQRRQKVDDAFANDDDLRKLLFEGLGSWSGPSLREMLLRVLSKTLTFHQMDFEKITAVIRDARNSLSHKSGNVFTDEDTIKDVLLSTIALENLIRIWLLKKIEFDDKEITAMLDRSHRMKTGIEIFHQFAQRSPEDSQQPRRTS